MSPIRYAGGKSLAVGHVVERLPEIKKLVSPFFGGGSVEISIAKTFEIELVATDILTPLVKYWQAQINQPEELAKQLLALSPTKETFKKSKVELENYWKSNCAGLADIDIAVLFFFTFSLSYGPSFLGWPSNIYLNGEKYKKLIDRVREFSLPKPMDIEDSDFETMFEKHPNEFFFIDPPYMLKDESEDSKMFAGIYPQRNFPVHHKGFPHEKLRELIAEHKGGFILTYNDCSLVREYYKDFSAESMKWQYTMGQGETRISKNREGGNHIKESHEILISSF